jgi:hypothetical protein
MSEHRTEIVSVRLEPPLRLYVEPKAKRARRTLWATIATLIAAALEADTARGVPGPFDKVAPIRDATYREGRSPTSR